MTIFVQSITAFRLAMTFLCIPMQDHAYEEVDSITLAKVVRIICNWQPICEAALLPATLDLHLSQREFLSEDIIELLRLTEEKPGLVLTRMTLEQRARGEAGQLMQHVTVNREWTDISLQTMLAVLGEGANWSHASWLTALATWAEETALTSDEKKK